MRTVTDWLMCIDYRKLNSLTRKDHFPLHFLDQVLESIVGHAFYYFLDGYSSYNQIEIVIDDHKKQLLHVLLTLFLTKECHFDCVTLQPHFSVVC